MKKNKKIFGFVLLAVALLLTASPLHAQTSVGGGGGGGEASVRAATPTKVNIISRSAPRRTVTFGTRALAGTIGLVSAEAFSSPEFIFPVEGVWGGVRAITLRSLGKKLAEAPIVNGRARIDLNTTLPPGATTFQYFVEMYPNIGGGSGEFKVRLELETDERVRLEGVLPDTALFLHNPNIQTGNAAVWSGTAPSRVIAGMHQKLATFPIPADNTSTEGTERKLTFYADTVGFSWGNVNNLQLVVKEGGGETTYPSTSSSDYRHPFRHDVTTTRVTFDGVIAPETGAIADLRGKVFGQPTEGVRRTVSVWADLSEWEVVGESTRLSLVPFVVGPGLTLGEQTATFGTAEVKVTQVQGEIKYVPVLTFGGSGSQSIAVAAVVLNASASDFPALLSKLAFGWIGQGVSVSDVRLYRGETLAAIGKPLEAEPSWWAALLQQQAFTFEPTEAIRYEAGKDAGPQLRLVCTFKGFGIGQWGLREINCVSPDGADAVLSFSTTDAPVIILPPFMVNPFFGTRG